MVTKGYGITVDDIDNSCPADLEPYAKAYKLAEKYEDTKMWVYCGNYILNAVAVAIENNLAGKKSKLKYMNKSILQEVEENELHKNNDRAEYRGMSNEEKQKAELQKAINYFNSLKARF